MSPALQHLGYAGLKKETTWGTKDVSSMDFLHILSDSIKTLPAPLVSAGINNTRFINKRQAGQKVTAGGIVFEVNPEDGIGTILKQVLPSETFVDDGVGNGGQHTFVGGSTLPAGLTVQIDRDVTAKDYEGGRCHALGFSLTADGLLTCTPELTFEDESDGTPQSPTYSTENEFKGADTTAVVNVDGSSADLISFDLAIATGMIMERKAIGKNLVIQQQPGVYDVTGAFTMFYDNETLVNKIKDHATFSVDLQLKGALIGTTTRAIKFDIPNAYFNGEDPGLSSRDGEIILSFTFQAIKIVGSELVSIKLDNSQRTAY